MSEHTPTPWRVVGGTIHASDKAGYVAELSSPRGGNQRDTDAAFIVKAVNNHDALVKELEAQRDYWADRVTDIAGELQEGEKYSAIMADRIAHFSERAEHINGILRVVSTQKEPS
jgi:hypothetical protein